MPATSKTQFRLFSMAVACKKGELPKASDEVKKLADSMSLAKLEEYIKDVDFKSLPDDKKQESLLDKVSAALTESDSQSEFERLAGIVDENDLAPELDELLQDIVIQHGHGPSGHATSDEEREEIEQEEGEWEELRIYHFNAYYRNFDLRDHSPGWGFTTDDADTKDFEDFEPGVQQKILAAMNKVVSSLGESKKA